MATRLYPLSVSPRLLLNLQSIDAGDLVTPDGRSHPITGLTPIASFANTDSTGLGFTSTTDGSVGVPADPTPVSTGPTYDPTTGTTSPGGGTVQPSGNAGPTWSDFFNTAASVLTGGVGSTAGPGSAQTQPGTHFGIPHLGIRLIVGVVGIGILLIVAARLAFAE